MLHPAVLDRLFRISGKEHVLTAPEDLICYAYDATPHEVRPSAIVIPGSAEEVVAIMSLANEHRIPVVPRGSGTNLSGGAVPVAGGLVLLTQRLNRIIEIDEENLTATAQPGVILGDFHRQVESRGLLYPPDPASLSVATLGGTVAEGAGGPRGVKYGTTRDYVLGLEVVLATGEKIRTGGKAVKSVSGYNLTQLFVASEGTLGVITEVTVRLVPMPQARRTCLAIFDTIEGAAQTVSAIIHHKIVPAALELIDRESIGHIEDFRPSGLPRDAEAVLLIEVDGSAADVDRQMNDIAQICQRGPARELRVAGTAEEREALWQARRSHYPALARARPNIIIEDVTVPRPALPQMIRLVREAAARHGIRVGMVAHAGEGNLHPDIMCDVNDPEEMERVERFTREVFQGALELGGTLSGEHGIGLLKAPYLEWQFGVQGMAVMRRIKAALDPNNILNPGKVLPL